MPGARIEHDLASIRLLVAACHHVLVGDDGGAVLGDETRAGGVQSSVLEVADEDGGLLAVFDDFGIELIGGDGRSFDLRRAGRVRGGFCRR